MKTEIEIEAKIDELNKRVDKYFERRKNEYNEQRKENINLAIDVVQTMIAQLEWVLK